MWVLGCSYRVACIDSSNAQKQDPFGITWTEQYSEVSSPCESTRLLSYQALLPVEPNRMNQSTTTLAFS